LHVVDSGSLSHPRNVSFGAEKEFSWRMHFADEKQENLLIVLENRSNSFFVHS